MHLGKNVIGGCRDDGEGSQHVAAPRTPAIPQSGKKYQKRMPAVIYAVKNPYSLA
jgi:hypothetical protein